MSNNQQKQTIDELLFGKRISNNHDMTYLVINNHFECTICEKKNEMFFTQTDILCQECHNYLKDTSKHCLHGKNKLLCFECSGPKQ